jgi:hypothetical protein
VKPSALTGLLCALACLASCGGGGADTATPGTGSTVPGQVSQDNATIAQLVYGDTQRTPPGFALDPVPSLGMAVQTRHLRNTDVGNAGAAPPHELCSDDFAQALQWSEAASTQSGNYAPLTGNDSTDRYFEFDRTRQDSPQAYLRERVFRCAYLDRDDTDLALPAGAAGQLNELPRDATGLRALSEYLWQFTPYDNYGNVVLRSAGGTHGTLLTHSLFIATLHRAADAGACDTIEVLEWRHSMDTGTGDLTLGVATLWTFHASDAGGVAAVCSG